MLPQGAGAPPGLVLATQQSAFGGGGGGARCRGGGGGGSVTIPVSQLAFDAVRVGAA